MGVGVRVVAGRGLWYYNNISALLLEDNGENHRHVANHRQTLSHNVVSNTPPLSGIQTQLQW